MCAGMAGPRLIHCSYHKCLTVYYGRVMRGTFNKVLRWSRGYRHFNSNLDEFLRCSETLRIASVNNRLLSIDRLGDFRMTRFIRDPRDLVVSGYFYHRRGSEEWTSKPNPTRDDWSHFDGIVPDRMQGSGLSFAQYLESLPVEDGLLAELEFRRAHLESMAGWPTTHPNILVLRYEDVLGREEETFSEMFEHYGFSALERATGMFFVRRHALRRTASDPHVRNPSAGQWRKHFTPKVSNVFNSQYAALIGQLGYPQD